MLRVSYVILRYTTTLSLHISGTDSETVLSAIQ